MANKISLKAAAIGLMVLTFVSMTMATTVPDVSTSAPEQKPEIKFDTTQVAAGVNVSDSKTSRWLPGELKDTTMALQEWQTRQKKDLRAQINILSRAYGDSIVLRWAPDDYTSWLFLTKKGVNILRKDMEKGTTDTLVTRLKPATLEEFRATYSETDSLASMAMGTLYGDMSTSHLITEPQGSVASIYEMYQEQQMIFGVAVMVSELRRDLADRLAMRYVDTNVKKGATYEYYIVPSEYDETGHVVIDAGTTGDIKNEKYRPEPFDVRIGDTIVSPVSIRLWWERRAYSSYEIERREKGTTEWMRLNSKPYVIMFAEQEELDCFYGDKLPKPAAYEYRVFAHDPFGDLTEPSPIHTVHFPDLIPPRAPMIKYIEIERPNEDKPGEEVWANIHFEKDTLEEDFIGMMPMYYNKKTTNGEWKPLIDSEKLLAPTDTVCRIDVTNIPSSQFVIAAYDTAHNVSYSMPQLLRVSDMRPPVAPTGLTAKTGFAKNAKGEPVGTITLTWDKQPTDDIDYFEVIFANDSTHNFMTHPRGIVRDTTFTDTIAVDVNQKYIYYKVRAVDYATNEGPFSYMLQVIRPSLIPPTIAHLDSASVDNKGVYMRWITGADEQMAYHKVYRRHEGSKRWQLIATCNADSIKALDNTLVICDRPRLSAVRYEYAVESFNFSDISSGLSLVYSANVSGDSYVDIPIKLEGVYDAKNKETRIAWEVDEKLIEEQVGEGFDWYFCIWRQADTDDKPKFFMSTDKKTRLNNDWLLRPGHSAKYYVIIQLDKGRESAPSNVVTVSAPK